MRLPWRTQPPAGFYFPAPAAPWSNTAVSQPEMILDYASPRKRSSLRMASKSLLDCTWLEDGVVVREYLDEQAQAIIVVVGSTLTIIIMLALLLVAGEWRRTPPAMLALPGLVFAAWAVVTPLVIQHSWSRTELSVRDGTVRLWMGGPLSHRLFTWRVDQVNAVRMIAIPVAGVDFALGEIEILAEGTPPIRLFTDHTEWRLAAVGQAVDLAMKGERPHPVPPEPRPDLRRFHFGARHGE
jgi:hypothetical protein